MLRASDLRAGYGSTPVLFGIDLVVEPGERVAILGRNGVGKTTLMRAIAGSVPMTGGELWLGEVDLGALAAHQRARLGISHVPQGRDIFPKLTVEENLKVGAAAHGTLGASHLEEAFAEFPALAEKRKAKGGSLSGGQQQILALARALMTDPDVLLLDEPSEGIAPSILDEFVDVIEKINSERKIAVVLVEQNLDFAARVARRGLIMEKGELTAELDTADLSSDRDLQRRYMAL